MDHLAAAKNVVSPLALAGAGVLGLAVPASAASMPSVTYSCSLAGYAPGLAPLSIPAELTAQSAAGTVTVTLTTQPAALPPAAAAALPPFSYLRLAGAAPSNGMSATADHLRRPVRRRHPAVPRQHRGVLAPGQLTGSGQQTRLGVPLSPSLIK